MQLFSHNLWTLIPNLPHAKLYFVFFLLKIQKQNGRQNWWKCHNLHHGLAYNDHKKHYFGVLKPTRETYLKSPKFHLVRLPIEDKIQNGRHFKTMCHNFTSK